MNVQHTYPENTISSKLQDTADTRLHGRWLMLARVVWFILVALALLVFIFSLPVYIAQLQSVCNGAACGTGQLTPQILETLRNLGFSIDEYVTINVTLALVQAFVWFTVGGVLFWRKSNDWMALLVSLMMVLQGASVALNTVAGSSSLWQFPSRLLDFLAYLLLILVILLFPNGRFVPRWTWLLIIVFIPVEWFYDFLPNSSLNNDIWTNLIWIGIVISFMATQIYRYRRVSNLVQRQQTKWVVFALIIGLLVEAVFALVAVFFPSLNQSGSLYWLLYNNISTYTLLLIPLSLFIAILRYRLWDIDNLINRTLVYGTLTVLLALVYFGLIFVLQFLLRGVINQTNDVVIVVSTLMIAALFQPLRRRIQAIIDRRFYRRKYDAAKTLEAFSATLRNEVDLDKLSEHLLDVVQETMEPEHVSLWLRKPTRVEEDTSNGGGGF
ncbi:MAG TPA: hypothetical protein VIX20_09325 [Ktedonobacteraceae bacterium]